MDFYKSEETYLAHYGVMGMKWGHRKQKEFYKTIKKASETSNDESIKKYLNKNLDSNTKKRWASLRRKAKTLDKQYDRSATKAMKDLATKKGLDSEDKYSWHLLDKELGKNKKLMSLKDARDKAFLEKGDYEKKLEKQLLGRYGNKSIKILNKNTNRIYKNTARAHLSWIFI